MKLTQVYRYGLLEPTMGQELLNQQLVLAHRYRNKLVEIERTFREERTAAVNFPELMAIDAAIGAATDTETRKTLWQKRRDLVRNRLAQPEVAAAIEKARSVKFEAIREARSACGVFWGTYLIVEQAAEAAASERDEPRFQPWTGSGAVAVQLQGGLSVNQLTAAMDSRAQIALEPVPVPDRDGKPLPRVRLRIGSEGREPIWAEWPMIYHRPLPEGSTVKWIKAARVQTAGTRRWSLHVIVEREIAEHTGEGVLALDLRWRGEELDGEMTRRAGEWTDGQEKGVIVLDPAVVGALRKVEDLKSIRDRLQNEMHARFLDWAKGDLPMEHQERLAHVAQWKSPRRFAAYCIWWRDNRLPFDTVAFEALEAWRKKDKHLWQWEAHARLKALRRRQDQYRLTAARLVREHDALVIEKLALDRLAVKPADDDPGQHKARSQRTDTAPSELRMAFINAFRREGKPVYEVKAGPLSSVWQAWCERQGAEKKSGPDRSKRFNRFRGITIDATPYLTPL